MLIAYLKAHITFTFFRSFLLFLRGTFFVDKLVKDITI